MKRLVIVQNKLNLLLKSFQKIVFILQFVAVNIQTLMLIELIGLIKDCFISWYL
jgi:hypothetical protein